MKLEPKYKQCTCVQSKILCKCLTLYLTYLPLDNMAAILADDNFKCIFLNEKLHIFIQISLKFVPLGPIDNNTALV